MTLDRPAPLAFRKMHGLGNDFVILDARRAPVALSRGQIAALGDRHRGIGFDQLAIIAPGEGDAALTFYNADGTQSAACGNATRCIADLLMQETGKTALTLTTARGVLRAVRADDGTVAVNMGAPMTGWADIPLSHAVDTLALPLAGAPTATGMGNPHCTFFVDDAEAADLDTLGPATETDPLFPERTNVQIASVIGPDHLRMRVWERGVGVTLASGSSSCATVVAAARRGLTGRRVTVALDGGTLLIDWRDDGVWMQGPTAHVFDGQIVPAWLEAHA